MRVRDASDPESNAETFVVRIWMEATGGDGDPRAWRGHVTHVMSGERRYVQSFDAIAAFITGHLRWPGAGAASAPE